LDGVTYVSYIFRGVDQTTPMDVAAVTNFSVAAAAPTCGSITPVTQGAKIVRACGASVNDATVTAPSGYTNQINSSVNDNEDAVNGMAILTQQSPAATGTQAWSGVTAAPYVCVHSALRPGS
jgi:hypothetical protein